MYNCIEKYRTTANCPLFLHYNAVCGRGKIVTGYLLVVHIHSLKEIRNVALRNP
jgi:hypothetical protein